LVLSKHVTRIFIFIIMRAMVSHAYQHKKTILRKKKEKF